MPLDFTTSNTEILLNPRLPKVLGAEAKLRMLKGFEGHVWVATSGSRKPKFVALSKKALLASAKGVNDFIDATSSDMWFNPLPLFHVGGLGVWARAYLSGAGVAVYPDVTKQKWNVSHYYQALQSSQATLTSLVPAQVYDLISQKLKAPSSLRAVFVGGGHLSEALFEKGLDLGWPICITYGLTECCSQVATAKPQEKEMKLLNHVEARMDSSSVLYLKSPALFTAYAYETDEGMALEDPKRGGWFRTNDLAELHANQIKILGRTDDVVKIGGEIVLVSSLEKKLHLYLTKHGAIEGIMLVTTKDDRLGLVLEALAENQLNRELVERIVAEFNREVLPFERIRHIRWVDNLPRTILGKMVRSGAELFSHSEPLATD